MLNRNWKHSFILLTAACMGLTLAETESRAQVVLNEVLADNRSAVANGGNYPDYIELYNPTGSPVNVGNWSLSDDPLLPRQFVFPAGATVPANGFLVVWADLNFASPGLHTGFGLGAKGDHVRLYAPDGITMVDQIAFGLQVGDLSLGRVPDGTGVWVLNQPSVGLPNTTTVTGDASQLRLNEWMARPATGDDWLEVFNADDRPVALGGLVITDQPSGTPGNRAIPAHSFIAAGDFVQFFASDLDKSDADHLDFKLATEGETLTIYAANRTTILDRVVYGAQTQNVSQGRAPDGSENFAFFPAGTATPGASNFQMLTNITISEVLTHTDLPFEDAIELQNLTAASVDISHWWLSDSGSQPQKYRIPAGTVIAAHGFKVFYHVQFGAGETGFALNSSEGDEVYLSAGNSAGNLTGKQMFVRFGALKNRVSAGRHATSTGVDFVPLSQLSFGVANPATVVQFRQGAGLTNAAPRIGPIVINEIMFFPPDVGGQPNTDEEFIELHNPGAVAAFLYDQLFPTNTWRLRDGVTFDFPPQLSIPTGGFLLLVSFDPVASPAKLTAFRTAYNVPANVPVLGPYTGKLSDTGEALEVLEPDTPQGPLSPNPGFVPYMQTERIKYASAAPWPTNAAGSGRSLQRRVSLAYGNEPLNWVAGTPSAGRANVIDSDGDGMPDAWEDLYELNLNSPLDATDDEDLDGATNLMEYQTGTNPRDIASVFTFTSISRDGDSLRLRFHAVQGRTYALEATDPLLPGAWQLVTNLPAVTATGEVELVVAGATNTNNYFRLLTPILP
ncbi:MAG: lamin tail domain-containing protein [Verrucomicrobiae bacterium]|nr:lamin tail domain-containing protein [Verrucomicrobiae bacterium]